MSKSTMVLLVEARRNLRLQKCKTNIMRAALRQIWDLDYSYQHGDAVRAYEIASTALLDERQCRRPPRSATPSEKRDHG